MGTENKYDFVIADINGRFNSLLKAKEYKILTKCKSLDELIIKLNHYIPFINEDMDSSISELKSRLYKSIHCELEDFKDCDLVALDCFKDYNLIHSFFTILETGHQKPEANYIDEYKCLLTYKSFKDIENLCIKGFRIEKFFEGVSIEDKIEDNNLQKMYCQVQKNFFDYYYNLAEGYLLEILETEADRQIIEICINNKEFRERRNLFPRHSRISEAAKDRLCGDTNIKTILNINSGDPIRNCVIKQAKMYAESFRQYGDTSCIYSYFRLKELEARNILWIAECILQKNREHINEYITFE